MANNRVIYRNILSSVFSGSFEFVTVSKNGVIRLSKSAVEVRKRLPKVK